MKKLLILSLAFLLLFSTAACGSKKEEKETEAPKTTEAPADTEGQDDDALDEDTPLHRDEPSTGAADSDGTMNLDDLMNPDNPMDIIFSEQDEATKQQMIADGKADGYDISFGKDGSTTIVDTETGEIMVQNADGTWSIQGEDGSVSQFGGDWPENEFTKLLPKPDFKLLAASTNPDEFAVGGENATIEDVKAYVEKVKAKGFTIDAETTDQETMGMVIYNYVAKNKDGYTVTVSFAMGTSAIILTKP